MIIMAQVRTLAFLAYFLTWTPMLTVHLSGDQMRVQSNQLCHSENFILKSETNPALNSTTRGRPKHTGIGLLEKEYLPLGWRILNSDFHWRQWKGSRAHSMTSSVVGCCRHRRLR